MMQRQRIKECVVITEGKLDEALLRSAFGLANDTERIKIKVAGGWSSAESLSRSIMLHDNRDVALVVDADTIDEERALEREQFHKDMIRSVSLGNAEALIVVVKPELEALLFRDLGVAEEFFEGAITQEDLIRGQYEPTTIIRKYISLRNPEEYRKRFTEQVASHLRKQPEIEKIRAFLQRRKHWNAPSPQATGQREVANLSAATVSKG